MTIVWIVALIILTFGVVAFRGAPYVPSKRRDVERALTELYALSSDDVLVDIGSGDGVVLRVASRQGSRAIGYEIHPLLVAISKWLSRHDSRVTTRLADFWKTQLPDDTTIVYTFGDGRDIDKMARKVQAEATRLGRPVWFMSYGFGLIDHVATRELGAHKLYQIQPLQVKKP